MGENTKPNQSVGEENKKNPESVRPLRTLESDAAEVMNRGDFSMTTIAVAEAERSKENAESAALPEEPQDLETSNRNKLIFVLGGIIIASGFLIAIGYFFFKPAPKPSPPAISGKPILVIDQEKTFDISGYDGAKIIALIIKARDTEKIPLNSTVALKFRQSDSSGNILSVSTSDIISKISDNVPGQLLRSLAPDFVAGIISYDGNQPFFIFKTDSFAYAYAGMIKWEESVHKDIGKIFYEGSLAETGTQSASSTDNLGQSTAAFGKHFQDLVVDNIDTRVVKNLNDDVVMLYAFVDQSTLVLTTNPKTLMPILSKLRAVKI